MKLLYLFMAICTSVFLFSCEKDFTATTEKEESYAVYCLLNLKDSANYVRINRVFLTPGDPGQYFQVADSVNIRAEDFEVTLLPYLNGNPGNAIVLDPSDDRVKDEGLFSSMGYQTFKTKQQLVPGRNYRLTVRNKLTGFEMHASTDLLGGRTLENAFKEPRYYNINQYHPETIEYDGDLTTGQWEKRVERFMYYEYEGDVVSMKYVDWRSHTNDRQTETGGRDEAQLSDAFLQYLAEQIPAKDTSVRRQAVGVDKMLIINDKGLTIFIDYTEDLSSGHYLPVLTNFDKGAGFLGSRYYYTFFAMKLKKGTIDTLAYGRFTGHLRFADSQGNWPPKPE